MHTPPFVFSFLHVSQTPQPANFIFQLDITQLDHKNTSFHIAASFTIPPWLGTINCPLGYPALPSSHHNQTSHFLVNSETW
jgi:hypothetical protein